GVGEPRNGIKALNAVRDSRGLMTAVSDADIVEAIHELARFTGVFAEPAGAAAYAGFKKLLQAGAIGADDRVLILVTGNGLKDIKSARRAVGDGRTIAPDLEQLAGIIEGAR
ncbi:MAG: pyridoxal-phosphate dependent enzyme, partial [Limnochordales bacterium]